MIPYRKKQKIFSALDYRPHIGQVAAHKSRSRIVLVAGAERGGKSRWGSAEATCELIYPGRRVAVCGGDYDETRPEMTYVLEDLAILDAIPKFGATTPKQGKWEVETKTGSYIESVSLRDGAGELTGRGRPYHFVLLVEAGRIRDLMGAFLAAVGRVSETRGRLAMVGTLWDDFGEYAELYKAFKGPNLYDGEMYRFPAWENEEIYPRGPNGEENPEIARLRAILPAAEFARRVGAELIASPARIYPEFSIDHIRRIEWDPMGVVDVAIDPGYFPSKYAVLALQPTIDAKGRECVHVIDELWLNHCTHHDVVPLVKEKPWWDNVRRIYGGHETKQHPSSKSTAEVWRELTGRPFTIVSKEFQWTKINRVKTFLRDPADGDIRLFIDVKCKGLAEEFRSWKRKTDAHGDVRSDEPEDKGEDALDALGNYIFHRFGPVSKDPKSGRPGKVDIPPRG